MTEGLWGALVIGFTMLLWGAALAVRHPADPAALGVATCKLAAAGTVLAIALLIALLRSRSF